MLGSATPKATMRRCDESENENEDEDEDELGKTQDRILPFSYWHWHSL
jgi:hypothetical protein